MSAQEIVYLDLNKLEMEEKRIKSSSHSAGYDYENYLTEEDKLVIQPLDESEKKDIEFSETKHSITDKQEKKDKKVRLPCHMDETLHFCQNVCKFNKFCRHKR